jgi:hypothetical protein
MSSCAYIKNKGSTQTITKSDSGRPSFNNINWDANYDGNQAKINVDINDNGSDFNIHAKLDNYDLARLLNIPTISGDIDQRLQADFPTPEYKDIDYESLFPLTTVKVVPDPVSVVPFLRPQKKRKSHKIRRPLRVIKSPLKYKTPLPKTMRIHFSKARGLKKKTKGRSQIRHNKKSRKSTVTSLLSNIF